MEQLRMGPRTYLAHWLNWNWRGKNNTLLLTDPFSGVRCRSEVGQRFEAGVYGVVIV
jgi:hypothetical protein